MSQVESSSSNVVQGQELKNLRKELRKLPEKLPEKSYIGWIQTGIMLLTAVFMLSGPIRDRGAADAQRASIQRDLRILQSTLSRIEGAQAKNVAEILGLELKISALKERHDEQLTEINRRFGIAEYKIGIVEKYVSTLRAYHKVEALPDERGARK